MLNIFPKLVHSLTT